MSFILVARASELFPLLPGLKPRQGQVLPRTAHIRLERYHTDRLHKSHDIVKIVTNNRQKNLDDAAVWTIRARIDNQARFQSRL